jgi:hypothetical protein
MWSGEGEHPGPPVWFQTAPAPGIATHWIRHLIPGCREECPDIMDIDMGNGIEPVEQSVQNMRQGNQCPASHAGDDNCHIVRKGASAGQIAARGNPGACHRCGHSVEPHGAGRGPGRCSSPAARPAGTAHLPGEKRVSVRSATLTKSGGGNTGLATEQTAHASVGHRGSGKAPASGPAARPAGTAHLPGEKRRPRSGPP